MINTILGSITLIAVTLYFAQIRSIRQQEDADYAETMRMIDESLRR